MTNITLPIGQPLSNNINSWPSEILKIFSQDIRRILTLLPSNMVQQIEEIRLRKEKPLLLVLNGGDLMLNSKGQPEERENEAYYVKDSDINQTLQLISDYSVYAFEEELKRGFITLKGGHRVGITGKTILENSKIKTIKYVNSLNIRISKEIIGAADQLIPYLWDSKKREIYHTLIISPPGCGKTTLLRDLIRQFSSGIKGLSIKGQPVGLVDERAEIAGCYLGIPQKNVGLRTDVLDGCPKAEGMVLLLRAMGPKIIAADEIGREEDALALEEVLNAGVKILTTAHGSKLEDLIRRPTFKKLINANIFERIVILGRSKGVGTIEKIIEGVRFKTIPFTFKPIQCHQDKNDKYFLKIPGGGI